MINLFIFLLLSSMSIESKDVEIPVEGFVFDMENELGIADAIINIYFDGDLVVSDINTDEEGRFLATLPNIGTYLFEVVHEKYKTTESKLEVEDEEVVSLAIGMEIED